MKIGQPSDTRIAGSSNGVAKAGPSAPKSASTGSTTSAAAAGGVPVTLSSAAQALEANARNADVDMNKVESVRTAIANGTYQVNAEAIADKLLSNAREMLGRRGR